jgi:hypothetical protein
MHIHGAKRLQDFDLDKSGFPDKTADFLLENRVEANIFNQFNKAAISFGDYPHYRLFNDTRFINKVKIRMRPPML